MSKSNTSKAPGKNERFYRIRHGTDHNNVFGYYLEMLNFTAGKPEVEVLHGPDVRIACVDRMLSRLRKDTDEALD